MENHFNKDTLFYIIPEDIQYSSTFKYAEKDEYNLIFNNNDKIFHADPNDEIEVFSNSINGILYFKSYVISYENERLTIKNPTEMELIQRRENVRIPICETIYLTDADNKEISANIIDLSVGGLKISVKEQLIIKKEYISVLNFDNLNLKFKFIPLRIACEENVKTESYIISGQIFLESPKDKIELVQYCYKKQFEKNNRG